MSLKLKLQLIVGALSLLFVVAVVGMQLQAMRDSVREEVVAANRVATQILNRTAALYRAQGTPAMLAFLRGLGRVRSTEITLHDAANNELYRSPPSPYKAGRNAPAWFEALITPPPSHLVVDFPDGKFEIHSNASRAALDAWDAIAPLLAGAAALLVVLNVALAWVLGRTVRPFGRIVRALGEVEAGRFDAALPPLPGREAATIGAAFNRMVGRLREQIETEKRALLAETQLSESRELASWIDQQIEQERRAIARELHDELGQSVTAMRSLALSITQRAGGGRDPETARAAQVIADEASRLYDAMHGLIPRLAPLVLDRFGLGDALADLAERTRRSQPQVQIELDVHLDAEGAAGAAPLPLNAEAALALYRAGQEGITNALRHGQADRLRLALRREPGQVVLEVEDNGTGLASDWSSRSGHHGLRWMGERIAALHGRFTIGPAVPRGVRLTVSVPISAASTSGMTGTAAVALGRAAESTTTSQLDGADAEAPGNRTKHLPGEVTSR